MSHAFVEEIARGIARLCRPSCRRLSLPRSYSLRYQSSMASVFNSSRLAGKTVLITGASGAFPSPIPSVSQISPANAPSSRRRHRQGNRTPSPPPLPMPFYLTLPTTPGNPLCPRGRQRNSHRASATPTGRSRGFGQDGKPGRRNGQGRTSRYSYAGYAGPDGCGWGIGEDSGGVEEGRCAREQVSVSGR
jgi:hypothetical protein